MRTGPRLLVVALIALWAQRLPAQSVVESALAFYAGGGAYCFRIAPAGTALADEDEWTVMVLTSASDRRSSFRIRSVEPGGTGLRGSDLTTAGRVANDVWKFDGTRAAFFEQFADGIRAGRLRAGVVKLRPPALARAASSRERADENLKFADKGSRVPFDKSHDLSAEQFLAYAEYLPD
jgi:hypothetical protein